MIVNNMIPKLYPLLVNISIIVQHMSLAQKKIPVPEVYDHGYSRNCSYILMEKVEDVLDIANYLDLMEKNLSLQGLERVLKSSLPLWPALD
jgi:hypothetical protein